MSAMAEKRARQAELRRLMQAAREQLHSIVDTMLARHSDTHVAQAAASYVQRRVSHARARAREPPSRHPQGRETHRPCPPADVAIFILNVLFADQVSMWDLLAGAGPA